MKKRKTSLTQKQTLIRAGNDFEIATLYGKLNMEKIVDINKYLKSAENVSIGVDPKFWVDIDGDKYLYKYYDVEKYSDSCRRGQMRTICEVFVSALCKKLGIDCVKASFGSATIDQYLTIGGKKTPVAKQNIDGCLIKSYLTKDVVEAISLRDITMFVQRQKDAILIVNDPKSTYETAKFFCDKNKYTLADDTLQKLKAIALFDYVSGQTDRHDSNIEFLVYKKDGKKCVKLAPLFDNGRCFGYRRFPSYELPTPPIMLFHMNKYCDSSEREELLSCVNGVAYELANDKELFKLFEEIQKINIDETLEELATVYGEKVPDDIAKFISYTWTDGIQSINEALVKISNQNIQEKIKFNVEAHRRKDYVSENKLLRYDNFYLQYRCAKQKGETKTFYDYFMQDREYRKKIDDWTSQKFDEMPKIEDFPLLCHQFSERQKDKMRDLIEEERSERWSEIKPYAVLVQKKYSGKNSKEWGIYDLFHEQQNKWVDYGDEWGERPTIEGVIKKYNKQTNKNSEGGRV